MTSILMKRLGAAVTTVALAASLVANSSAHADPKQYSGMIGVGSDTTQDVNDAWAGFAFGVNYVPLQSSVASGQRQITSFGAVPPAGITDPCITTKTGAASFTRPFGSTSGRRALSRAIDHAGYGSAACGGLKDVTGLITFARSSAGPAAGDLGTDLTYIPVGRDGISFAYYKASAGAPVTSLTRAQLTTIFSSPTATTINGVRILPCGIQTGSGTYNFWLTAANVSAGQEATATTECNNLTGGVRAEENNGPDVKTRGDLAQAAVPGTQVIIGFSPANFITKSNGVATPAIPAGVGIGSISDNGSGTNIGSPVAGVAPNLTPVASFYNDGTFGRRIYTVVPSTVLAGLPGVNADIKTMFTTASATICQAPALVTLQKFGFLPASDCGSTTIKGSLIAGTL